jgi:hypothetical protein
LLTALFAALVIAGLLGMHTFSTDHAESQMPAVSIAPGAMDADQMHATAASADSDAESDCLDCGPSDSHHAMIMACVLGLLVTLLLGCRAQPSLVRPRGPSIAAPFLRAAVALMARPPSLSVLSISRT